MIKKDNPGESEIQGFRRQIDEIDDKLIQLLIERIAIVQKVGEVKRRIAPGRCPIRPAREADMVRRIANAFRGTAFLPAAAAAIWRTIIGASTSTESKLVLSVFTPDRDNDLYWMAREYFGSFLQTIRQPHIKRVIGDVMDGKAAVGIVPMLRSADTTYWWTNLLQQGPNMPKIFAQIPFVVDEHTSNNSPTGLAIARLLPEPSGDDRTLLVLETEYNVSQNRLQTAFNNAKLEATWINIATLTPQTRHHLMEIKGFITREHDAMQVLLTSLGASVINTTFLGAYATPLSLKPKTVTQEVKAHEPV